MGKHLAVKEAHRQFQTKGIGHANTSKYWFYAASILTLLAGAGEVADQATIIDAKADATPVVNTLNEHTITAVSSGTSETASTAAVTDDAGAVVSGASSMTAVTSGSTSSVAASSPISISSITSQAEPSATSLQGVSNAVASSADISIQSANSNDILSTASTDTSLTKDISEAASGLDLVTTSQVGIQLTATSEATSAVTTSTSLVAPDLSAIASGIGSAYNETLNGVMTQLVGSAGVQNAVTLLTNVISQAGSLFGKVPGVSNIVSVANGVLNGVTQAIKIAAGLGIDPSSLVVTALTNGINGLGQAALTALTPVMEKIPVIGEGLVSIAKPILSNLSNVSPALIVETLANATGLGGVLSTVSNITQDIAPKVISAVQGLLNTAINVINGIKGFINNAMGVLAPILKPIENVISGLITPIQNVLSNIISNIKQKLFPNSTSNPATSADSSASSTTGSEASSNASSENGSAATVTPTLVTEDLTIRKGSRWSPLQNLVSAVASNGQSVALANITTQGTVNTQIPGAYYVMFSYADPLTANKIQSIAKITIQMPDPLAESQAASAIASATSAIAQGTMAINEVTSAINVLPHSTSNLASQFSATVNYPSSQVVYLPAASGTVTPDVNELGSYVMQYVNELRSANNQPALTYSASESAFAQTRAQQIVTNFSHDMANKTTEDLGGNRGITDHMQSVQEMAYFMVMDWYDESDNPESIGAGHYGHRANLLFGGPTMGVGFVRSTDPAAKFTDYYTFEAPAYKDLTLYNQAINMANAKSNPTTIPLPNVTFVYVDSPDFDQLYSKLDQLQKKLADDQATLVTAQNKLMTI